MCPQPSVAALIHSTDDDDVNHSDYDDDDDDDVSTLREIRTVILPSVYSM